MAHVHMYLSLLCLHILPVMYILKKWWIFSPFRIWWILHTAVHLYGCKLEARINRFVVADFRFLFCWPSKFKLISLFKRNPPFCKARLPHPQSDLARRLDTVDCVHILGGVYGVPQAACPIYCKCCEIWKIQHSYIWTLSVFHLLFFWLVLHFWCLLCCTVILWFFPLHILQNGCNSFIFTPYQFHI